MKKFIIVLMVVAAASFLLVGCLPGTTTPVTPVEPVEPVEAVVVTTVAPIITSITDNAAVPAAVISLTSTATQYMNKAEVALGIIVNGTAPTYSEVKVYIDDICAGTADVGVSGTFSVVIAKADLGLDEDKVIYATAKEAALPVSAKSVEYAFTLDTVAPKIKEVKATGSQAYVAGASAITAGGTAVATTTDAFVDSIVSGTWTVEVNAATAITDNVSITAPDGTITKYTAANGEVFAADNPIPGVQFTLNGALAAGQSSAIVCVASVPTILGRATLAFDDDVTFAAATGGTYTIKSAFLLLVDILTTTPPFTTFSAYNESTDTMFWVEGAVATDIFTVDTLFFEVSDVADSAGNVTSAATESCVVGLPSATALRP